MSEGPFTPARCQELRQWASQKIMELERRKRDMDALRKEVVKELETLEKVESGGFSAHGSREVTETIRSMAEARLDVAIGKMDALGHPGDVK